GGARFKFEACAALFLPHRRSSGQQLLAEFGITVVPRLADRAGLDSVANRALGLGKVGAVSKATVFPFAPQLRKAGVQPLYGQLPHADLSEARCVHDGSARRRGQQVERRPDGGMLALTNGLADLAHSQRQPWENRIDER